MIGAVQGASCFGPAYEFLFILETELRRRKLRDRVPMTFVTSEPYIGHLGLDGVGDTKGLLESEMREKHVKWITNARVKSVAPGTMSVEEIADDGSVRKSHELPFAYSMMLPAFRGVAAIRGIEKLTNPRGFVIVDKYQRNPEFPNVFGIGVCVAIAPVGATPVPVGVPKTGFMIESMVTATARNIGSLLRGEKPTAQPTWNAICLADFGDSGVAFLAQPQIPPRNVNWSSKGEWVHYAKVAFEKYFLRKIRRGESEPFYERFLLDKLNIAKVKEIETAHEYRPTNRLRALRQDQPAARRAGAGRGALRIVPSTHLHRPPHRGRRSGLRPPCREQRHPGAGRRLGAVVRSLPRDGADVRARRRRARTECSPAEAQRRSTPRASHRGSGSAASLPFC